MSADVEARVRQALEPCRSAGALDHAYDPDATVAVVAALLVEVAARDADVRRATREQIAQAIEHRATAAEILRERATSPIAHAASDEHAWAFRRAARIAREVTR